MKTTRLAALAFSFLTIVILDACRSGKNALEHGNYYEAVMASSNRLRRNSDHKKSIETLRQAYPLAVRYHEEKANSTASSAVEFKWREVVVQYTLLQNMYEEIMHSPGALKVIPNPNNYYTKLSEARTNAAEESYAAGNKQMMIGNRTNAKQAYYLFLKSNEYAPGYKDVSKKIEEAKWAATLKVAVEPIPAIARNYSVNAEYFDNKLNEYLRNKAGNEFVKFYSAAEIKSQKINPDHIVKLSFNEFSVGQVYVNEKELQPEKDSVVVAYSFTDSKGVVQKKDTEPLKMPARVENTQANTNTSTSSNTTSAGNSSVSNGNYGQQKKEEKMEQRDEKKEHIAEEKEEKSEQKEERKEEKADKEKLDKEKADKELAEKAEKERVEKEKSDKEKADREKAEKEKADKEKLDKEKADKELAEKAEKERVEKEKSDKEKADHEKVDKEKLEKEKADKELAEKAEKERIEKEKSDKEKADRERAEKEKADREKLEKEKADKELAEKAEKERIEKEKSNKEKADREKANREEEVTICHQSPGNSSERKTMTVPKSSLQAHLDHGDFMGDCSKKAEEKKEEKGKKKDNGSASRSMISWPNSQPVLVASAGSKDKMWAYFEEPSPRSDTTKIYGKVKATVRQYKKTITSKGVLNMRIVDAKTNAVLSEQRIPGEYVWTSEWLTYNGDARALTADQLKLAQQKEQAPPSNQELFKAFTQPIFDQVSVKIKDFYKNY